MRLFLASDDLGDHPDKLAEMVGNNNKTLLISNARDYKTPEKRLAVVEEDAGVLTAAGLEPVELDLRPYFGKPNELREYVRKFQPGLIFLMGGNTFLIATALEESGMDIIIREGLANNSFVYGGYSAGSMVAARNLNNYLDSYGKDDDRYDQALEIYKHATTEGLGIIDEYVCPHADNARFALLCEEAAKSISAKGFTTIKLNDADVFVIEDEKKAILRKKD